MKLKKIELTGIKRFANKITFDFLKSEKVNTISGMNGSGKSTIAHSLLVIQQAYFLRKLEIYKDNTFAEKCEESFYEKVASLVADSKGKIDLIFIDQDKEISISLTIDTSNKTDINTQLSISEEDDLLISKYWNLQNPINTIVYVESNKDYNESNTPINQINIKTKYELPVNRETWLTLNMVFFPKDTFFLLYKNMVMDYAHDRLVPTKGKIDLYYKIACEFTKYLFPHIKFNNFSLNNYKPDEVVNLISNSQTSTKRYDMRQMSAGEKTIFYLFLYINLVGKISLLIVDELENHLHEQLICKFTQLIELLTNEKLKYTQVLNQIGSPQGIINKLESFFPQYNTLNKISQVFLITHSKALIYSVFGKGTNYILNEELIYLDYEESEEKLRDIGISAIYDKVLFVEGKTDIGFLSTSLSDDNIKIEKIENCKKLIDIHRSIKDIKEHVRDLKAVFLLDADTSNDEKVKEYLDNNSFIILNKHEIENYLLDTEVWLEVLKEHEDAIEDKSIIEEGYIINQMKKIADSQQEQLKKLFLSNKIRNIISDIQTNIKHKDIVVENSLLYSKYVENLLSSSNIQKIREELILLYEIGERKYSSEEWNSNWINLCQGKQVLNIMVNKIAPKMGLTNKRLHRDIVNKCHEKQNSELMKLVKEIRRRFE
ncbi:hypothetical protein EXM30_04920 [Clostridium botulinum]|uniref:AAA family ATPase n=1 Tax=Clostridium botulinum TaxID=1491 RepID=UPI0007E0EE00|nr:AAA family ATPase [Clostridium botulinum]KEI82838.1 hypothetical protein N487_01435 [Clostridium botulinum B2 331]NFA89730.1 hypothetical protein [Clostridium botulinum]NFB20055.1 hypothetical protein [Clostridium botulinum]NFI38457.1 hypothetical protein [Clostridium botulinum]NFT56287.1 hypothetical protein [Clostridium botulinum]